MPIRPPIAATSSPDRSPSTSVGHASAEAGSRWRVLIVHPHSSIREMMRVILDGYADLIEVVGEASDGDEGIELAKTIPVDLVLMDTHLPNSVDATRQIRRTMPQVVVLGTSYEYTPYLYNAMIAAGAVAFIRMEDAATLLFRSIVFAMCTYGSKQMHMPPAQASGRRSSFAASNAS
jgi:DNA-binding NarL/FixJ family response regulator